MSNLNHFFELIQVKVILMLTLLSGSFLLPLLQHISSVCAALVPLFQIAACCMTFYVGYRAIKKTKG